MTTQILPIRSEKARNVSRRPQSRIATNRTTSVVDAPQPSPLRDIGIVGLGAVEPVLLAALVGGEPLLLIGAHGTGKSYLLNRIAQALSLEWRHYNASLLNYDDLVG